MPSIVFLFTGAFAAGAGAGAGTEGAAATGGLELGAGAPGCGPWPASIGDIMPNIVLFAAGLLAGDAVGAAAGAAFSALRSNPQEPQNLSADVRGALQAGQLIWAVIRTQGSKSAGRCG